MEGKMAQSIAVTEGNTPSAAYQNTAQIPTSQIKNGQIKNGQIKNGQAKNGEADLTSISLFQTSLLAALISVIIWLAITYILAI